MRTIDEMWNGNRGGRIYPVLSEWKTTATIHVLSDTITDEMLRTCLIEAGKFIGLGALRPEQGGINGRFEVL